MKRVSSRQRLVSWDKFDATANDSDYSDSEYSQTDPAYPVEGDTIPITTKLHTTAEFAGSSPDLVEIGNICADMIEITQGNGNTRKRIRSKQSGPAVVPCFDWETSNTSSTGFNALVEDVHLHIMSFLNQDSLRAVSSVNHKFREMLSGEEAKHCVWKQHFQKSWAMMESPMTSLVDSYAIPIAASAKNTSSNGTAGQKVNVPLLLSMTPKQLPSNVDEGVLENTRTAESFRRPRWMRELSRYEMMRTAVPSCLKLCEPKGVQSSPNSPRFVQYTGPIGQGDRCIRADHPLPRPTRKSSVEKKAKRSAFEIRGKTLGLHPSLLNILCRNSRAVTNNHPSLWRPFVSPRVLENDELDVTPSMVAYFEVDILANSDDGNSGENNRSRSRNECVAVGVATDCFHVHSRMPGWDSLSFGYHGDDGGIFHGSGGMIDQFGPKYGAGDTIGCGVDYVAQGIFFTLNGRFLGYGWKHVDIDFLQNDLYPVVGIDTNSPVAFNFGTSKPFAFDLKMFHKQHGGCIEPHYRFSPTSPPQSTRTSRRTPKSRVPSPTP